MESAEFFENALKLDVLPMDEFAGQTDVPVVVFPSKTNLSLYIVFNDKWFQAVRTTEKELLIAPNESADLCFARTIANQHYGAVFKARYNVAPAPVESIPQSLLDRCGVFISDEDDQPSTPDTDSGDEDTEQVAETPPVVDRMSTACAVLFIAFCVWLGLWALSMGFAQSAAPRATQ